jgi:hypothetical protein
MSLFQAVRHAGPARSEDIRVPTSGGGSRDLHSLAMVPGSPGYTARIPRPPCHRCGEDHFPGREYDHPWTQEPVTVHDEPVSATSIVRRPQIIDAEPAAPTVRLAIYVGRGDAFVVAVESSPDWDTVESWKVPDDQVVQILKVVRALGVKVADKTGGELQSLAMHDVSQHAQDYERGPARPGGGGPRRPGPAAGGEEGRESSGAA